MPKCCDMGERICIATWGNPQEWRFAEYYSEDQPRRRVRAFSTLNILHEIEQPTKTIIIALDTLADPDKLEECGSDYSCIEANVREKIGKYLCGIEAEIVVLPGVFSKRESGRQIIFRSDPQKEFLPLLIYELYDRLLNVDGELEVVLDISHGINFMPTLAYRAVTEVAAALAVARTEQVKLRVYQADPYPSLPREIGNRLARSDDLCKPASEDEPPSLRYNKIAEATFKLWDLSRYVAHYSERRLLTAPKDYDFDNLDELLEKALLLLGAYRLGALLQLGLLAKTTHVEDLERVMRRAVEFWRGKRRVVREIDGLKLESDKKFLTGFYLLLHGHAVLRGAKKLLSESESASLDEAIVTFKEIKELKKLLEGSKVVTILVDREISKLDNKVRKSGNIINDWTLYADILEKPEGKSLLSHRGSPSDMERFKRDFIAHAGFHDEVVELRMRNDIELRVRPSEWERVKGALKEAVA